MLGCTKSALGGAPLRACSATLHSTEIRRSGFSYAKTALKEERGVFGAALLCPAIFFGEFIQRDEDEQRAGEQQAGEAQPRAGLGEREEIRGGAGRCCCRSIWGPALVEEIRAWGPGARRGGPCGGGAPPRGAPTTIITIISNKK